MSPFNPDVPKESAPNFIGWSKTIETPQPDKSGEYLYSGLGQDIDQSTQGVDTYIKKNLDAQVHEQVDPERDSFTRALDATKGALGQTVRQKGNPAGYSPQANADDGLLSYAAADDVAKPSTPPPALDQSLNTVDSLQQGLAAKKISETYYYGQLSSIAKNLRSQYPGYRDYIDNKISQVTGVDPANAYIKSIISDIDFAASQSQAIKEKYSTQLRELNMKGVPGANMYLDNWTAGKISTDAVNSFVNSSMSGEWQHKQNMQSLEETSKGIETDKLAAAPVLDQLVDRRMNQAFQGTFTAGGQLSLKDTTDYIQKVVSGTVQPDEQKIQGIVQSLRSQKVLLQQQLVQEANAHESGKKSLSDRIGGPDATNQRINARLTQFDSVIDTLASGNYPLALTTVNNISAANNSTLGEIYKDPDLKRYYTMTEAIKKLPEKWQQQFFLENGIGSDVQPKLKALFTNKAAEIVTQPDFKTTGRITTMDQGLADLKKRGVTDPQFMESYLNLTKMLGKSDTPTEVKTNLAKAMFDPKNAQFLSGKNFQMDYTDPQTGKFVPGKYSVFTRMTSPDITHSVMQLKDPNVIQNYRNWTEESFGVHLFGNELNDLKDIQDTPWLHLNWDNEKHQFSITTDKGAPEKSFQQTMVSKSINRLNVGLQGLSNVEKATKGDVNSYLLNVLQNFGVDLSKNTNGIPEKMTQAIVNSRGPKKVEDTFEKKNSDRVLPGDLGPR